MEEKDLPLTLPEVDKFLPTETGEPPLARAANWTYQGHPLETTTMPGWAGSSWYYLRYMDPHNSKEAFSKNAVDYWQNIDLYVGGSEHAVGHLLYSRFWCKFLKDIGKVSFEEPFKKLINQGMVQGVSSIGYKLNSLFYKGENLFSFKEIELQYDIKKTEFFISYDLLDAYPEEEGGTNIEHLAFVRSKLDEYVRQIFGEDQANITMSVSFGHPFIQSNLPIEYISNNILNIEKIKKDSQYKDSFFIYNLFVIVR
jgi:leucyl-tRNA synthetase